MHTKLDTVYICDWLPPDFGAVGQYGLLFSRQMAEEGQRVALIGLSSSGNSVEEETAQGHPGTLRIVRLAAPPLDKKSTLRRSLWTIRLNTRLLRCAWPYIKNAKRIVFTGSPPFFIHWIASSKLIHRKPLTYRITDFHPECTIAERGGKPTLFLTAILALTNFWRRRVDEFEVLGYDQGKRLAEIGIDPDRMRLKPDPSPIVIEPTQSPLSRPSGFEGKTLLLYSGNWGVAHDVSTFVDGYTQHHRDGSGTVVLWLNAVGAKADLVAALLSQRDVPFHRGKPVPVDELAALLVTADAHLITLSDEFVGYVLPSKAHGCIASGKPTLFVGSEHSDVHRLCLEGLGRERYFRANVGAANQVATHLERIATHTVNQILPGGRE